MKTISRLNALYVFAKKAKVSDGSIYSFIDVLPCELKKVLKAYKEQKKEIQALEQEVFELKEELSILQKNIEPKDFFEEVDSETLVEFIKSDGTTGI